MMETSNLLGQSQTFCSYGVSNMNVLWLSITNQGLCVSEVQNVQAYVLEVGWGSLRKMDRDEKRAFHRDGMNWMWVGWYWKKKWDPYGVRLLCVLLWFAMICVCDLCILFVFCVCFHCALGMSRGLGYFLGKAPKWLAEEHRSGPGHCKHCFTSHSSIFIL